MDFKNTIITSFVSLVKKLQRKKKEPGERFLIVSTTALGDTLWGTPGIRALRKSHPHAYIAVLTSPIGEELLKYNRNLNELFILKKPYLFQYLWLFIQLKRRKIDTVFLFHTSQRFVLPFCSLLSPRKITGSTGINKGLDSLLTHPVALKPEHEIQRRLNILFSSGAKGKPPHMEIFLHPKDISQAKAFLEKQGHLPFLPLVGLHPGAKDKFKQWDPDFFIEVGNRIAHHTGAQIIITGTAAEKPLTSYIAKHIPGSLILPDVFPIRALSALIKQLSLFITNDTGPMHIAYASHTPTVALFTATDSKLCGPYFMDNATIIQKQKTCSPCLKKKCNLPFCLLQISPQEVYNAAIELFYRQKQN